MGQNFISGTVNQTLLFPPSLHDWLPEGHRPLSFGCGLGAGSERHLPRTFEDVAFRYLSGGQHPGHATIAEFRKLARSGNSNKNQRP